MLALWGKLEEAYISIGKYLVEMDKVKRMRKCAPRDLIDDLSFVRFATCSECYSIQKLVFFVCLFTDSVRCSLYGVLKVDFFGRVYGGYIETRSHQTVNKETQYEAKRLKICQ